MKRTKRSALAVALGSSAVLTGVLVRERPCAGAARDVAESSLDDFGRVHDVELDLSSSEVSEGGRAVAVAVLAGALGAVHSRVDAACA